MELITRYRDSNDDRVVIAELTEKGRNLKEEIVNVPEKVFCKVNMDVEMATELKIKLDELLEILRK